MYFTRYKTTDPYLNMNAYIVRKSLDKAVGSRQKAHFFRFNTGLNISKLQGGKHLNILNYEL